MCAPLVTALLTFMLMLMFLDCCLLFIFLLHWIGRFFSFFGLIKYFESKCDDFFFQLSLWVRPILEHTKKPFKAVMLSHNVCFVPATEAAPFYLWKEASGTECCATSEVCVELQVGTIGKVVQLPRLEKNILTFFDTPKKKKKNLSKCGTLCNQGRGCTMGTQRFYPLMCLRVIGRSHVAGAQVKLVAVQTELNNPTWNSSANGKMGFWGEFFVAAAPWRALWVKPQIRPFISGWF